MANDPDLVLETPRLRLLLPPGAAAAAVAAFHEHNRSHFAPFEPLRPEGFHAVEAWTTRLEEFRREFANDRSLRLWLTLREDGDCVGWAHFTQIVRGPFQACRLGYGIGATHEGQGLMTEALATALQYVGGELGLHRVEANHLPENARSARLLARLGFVVEGQARDYLRIAGAWRDHVLTSWTARED